MAQGGRSDENLHGRPGDPLHRELLLYSSAEDRTSAHSYCSSPLVSPLRYPLSRVSASSLAPSACINPSTHRHPTASLPLNPSHHLRSLHTPQDPFTSTPAPEAPSVPHTFDPPDTRRKPHTPDTPDTADIAATCTSFASHLVDTVSNTCIYGSRTFPVPSSIVPLLDGRASGPTCSSQPSRRGHCRHRGRR